jgi:hypothetical protein
VMIMSRDRLRLSEAQSVSAQVDSEYHSVELGSSSIYETDADLIDWKLPEAGPLESPFDIPEKAPSFRWDIQVRSAVEPKTGKVLFSDIETDTKESETKELTGRVTEEAVSFAADSWMGYILKAFRVDPLAETLISDLLFECVLNLLLNKKKGESPIDGRKVVTVSDPSMGLTKAGNKYSEMPPGHRTRNDTPLNRLVFNVGLGLVLNSVAPGIGPVALVALGRVLTWGFWALFRTSYWESPTWSQIRLQENVAEDVWHPRKSPLYSYHYAPIDLDQVVLSPYFGPGDADNDSKPSSNQIRVSVPSLSAPSISPYVINIPPAPAMVPTDSFLRISRQSSDVTLPKLQQREKNDYQQQDHSAKSPELRHRRERTAIFSIADSSAEYSEEQGTDQNRLISFDQSQIGRSGYWEGHLHLQQRVRSRKDTQKSTFRETLEATGQSIDFVRGGDDESGRDDKDGEFCGQSVKHDLEYPLKQESVTARLNDGDDHLDHQSQSNFRQLERRSALWEYAPGCVQPRSSTANWRSSGRMVRRVLQTTASGGVEKRYIELPNAIGQIRSSLPSTRPPIEHTPYATELSSFEPNQTLEMGKIREMEGYSSSLAISNQEVQRPIRPIERLPQTLGM